MWRMDKYFAAALLLAFGHLSIDARAAERVAPLESTAAAVAAYRAANPTAHQARGVSKRSPDTRKTRLSLPQASRAGSDSPRLLPPGRSTAH
jgi:hypothetical protein